MKLMCYQTSELKKTMIRKDKKLFCGLNHVRTKQTKQAASCRIEFNENSKPLCAKYYARHLRGQFPLPSHPPSGAYDALNLSSRRETWRNPHTVI